MTLSIHRLKLKWRHVTKGVTSLAGSTLKDETYQYLCWRYSRHLYPIMLECLVFEYWRVSTVYVGCSYHVMHFKATKLLNALRPLSSLSCFWSSHLFEKYHVYARFWNQLNHNLFLLQLQYWYCSKTCSKTINCIHTCAS